MKPKVEVYPNKILIEDYMVARPGRISPQQWEEFWALLSQQDADEAWQDGYAIGFEDARKEFGTPQCPA